MTQTSAGFAGTVGEVQWAALAPTLANGAGGLGQCAVTQVAGTRAVSVAAGTLTAFGVITTLSAAETVTIPTPTNGQWFLLVLNRIWASKTSSLMLRNGPTSATTDPGYTPTSYPASLANTPGVNADQPLAWLWANSSGTSVSIATLETGLPPANVVPRFGSFAQRDAFWGVPSGLAAQYGLQGKSWFNSDIGCLERYYGPYSPSGSNPLGTLPDGWYPVEGMLPIFTASISGLSTLLNNSFDNVRGYIPYANRSGTTVNGSINEASGTLTGFRPGRWRMHASLEFGANGTGIRGGRVLVNGSAIGPTTYAPAVSGQRSVVELTRDWVITSTSDAVVVQGYQNSGTTAIVLTGSTVVDMEYLGAA